jgi:nucleotide-binding universal stress UspA family protein
LKFGSAFVPIRRILVAVDEQPVSVRAGEFGAELARSLGGEIALAHVSHPGYVGDTGISPKEFAALAEQDSRRLLVGFRERLSLPPSTLQFVQVGTPAAEIVRTAREWPADLIVIASHGRTGVRRALLGSVAEGVMRNAPCPVLVVRAQA